MNYIYSLITKYAGTTASDIHLHEGDVPYVRQRGSIAKTGDEQPVTRQDFLDFMEEIGLAEIKKDELKRTGSCDVGYQITDECCLRLNFYLQRSRFGLATRLLRGTIPDFDGLNLPPVMKEVLKTKSGLVLVTGLTGNGKSTTIASLVNYINNTADKHIITIEDPIEYRYPKAQCLVTQREVHADCSDFEQGLRSALRQDPDIIVIGEMRDKETIEVALEAAESGHLVFSTLHTCSAASSIDRIVSYFSDDEQAIVRSKLSTVLAGVFTQKLIPALDNPGMYPAVEVMLPTVPIQSLIREGKIFQVTNYIKLGRKDNMLAMDDCLADMVLAGKISMDSALENANDQKSFISTLNFNKK